jgi:hypothetical protein
MQYAHHWRNIYNERNKTLGRSFLPNKSNIGKLAQFLPDIAFFTVLSGGHWREIDVLQHLQHTLSDGYEIFHSVRADGA